VLYGGENELHELALPTALGAPCVVEGAGVKLLQYETATVTQ
jgi:hypothetical protein